MALCRMSGLREKDCGFVISPYRAIDFSDVDFLNQICYEKPCTVLVLGEKLAHKSWVADEHNAVIGCIIVCPQDNKNLIWSLTVAPPFRNRGIGGQLMAEAEKHFPELYLHTERYGMAYGLYARRGYKEIGDLPNYYGAGKQCR